MANGYAFTLCKAADPGKLAAKRIVGKDDGSFEKFDYDRVNTWKFAIMAPPVMRPWSRCSSNSPSDPT